MAFWSQRAELCKSFARQEVLCLNKNFKSSWRQPQEEVTSSLDQSMSYDATLFVLTETLSLRTTSEPQDNRVRERPKIVLRAARHFSHIYFNIQKHVCLMVLCFISMEWFTFIFVKLCHKHSGAAAGLRVLHVQELLLGWCNTAVPGAGAVRPFHTGVVVGLASVHLLLDHQVRPKALLWSRDLTGQRGTAHDLQKHTQNQQISQWI